MYRHVTSIASGSHTRPSSTLTKTREMWLGSRPTRSANVLIRVQSAGDLRTHEDITCQSMILKSATIASYSTGEVNLPNHFSQNALKLRLLVQRQKGIKSSNMHYLHTTSTLNTIFLTITFVEFLTWKAKCLNKQATGTAELNWHTTRLWSWKSTRYSWIDNLESF